MHLYLRATLCENTTQTVEDPYRAILPNQGASAPLYTNNRVAKAPRKRACVISVSASEWKLT